MKRPKTFDLVMGHPLVGGPIALSAGVGLYASYQAGSAGMGFVCAALLGGVGKAQNESAKYRKWEKAWKAMSPDAAPRQPVKIGQILLVAIAVAVAVAYAINPYAVQAAAPGVAVLACLGALCVATWRLLRWVVRRFRRRHNSAGPFTVAVVARRVSPPSLANAYRALPRHCVAMLRAPQ